MIPYFLYVILNTLKVRKNTSVNKIHKNLYYYISIHLQLRALSDYIN